MLSETFKRVLSRYDEGRLLHKVYRDLLYLSPGKALEDVEEDKEYYLQEVTSHLSANLPEGYSLYDLEKDAEEYHKGMVYWLTYASTPDNVEEVLTQVVNAIKNEGKQLLLFTKDLTYVLELEKKELMFDTRKQLACMVALGEMSMGETSYIRNYIKDNDGNILRNAEEFRKVFNTDTLVTQSLFGTDMGYDIGMMYGKYTDKELKLLYGSDAKEMYLRYIEVLEDKTTSAGKEEAINTLKTLFPDKFKDVRNRGIVDLGGSYLTWIGAVRFISKGSTIGNTGETSVAITSESKELILQWVEYNSLYEEFLKG